jgi:hypothetical protein
MSSEFSSIVRRSFIKKSLITGVAISQPVFLAGLIRASGGGGSGTTKYGDYTSDGYTTFPNTTDPYFYSPPYDTTFFDTTLVYY